MIFSGFRELFRPARILIYADFIDPFCYIGFHSLRPLAERRGIEIDWRGFELNPDTPAEGLRLETGANSDLRPGMWASVDALAKKADLTIPEPQWIPNTRLAHELVELGKKFDVKNPLIESIYQAYFISRKDIGHADVLTSVAADMGLSFKQILSALEPQRYRKLLDFHRIEAHRYQFPGMPGFVYKGKTYFGALSTEAWEKILS